MRKRPMCPMMMMAPMSYMPTMNESMYMPMTMPIMAEDEDDRDEEYFASMHSDVCHAVMPYVMGTVDRMERKGEMIYEARPRREMVDRMTDEAYNDLVRDMPDMADEMSEERQFGGRRRFSRDIVRALLLSELLRRRRRRRRHHFRPGFGFSPEFENDFDEDFFDEF